MVSTQHQMTWTEYHSQDDIETFLDYLAETYDFVDVEKIGESYERRPMRVIKVWYIFSHRLIHLINNR